MKTHVITEGVGEGIESREIVLDGSTTCPRPEWCDRKDNEEQADYVRRHAYEHEMDFPSQTSIEDIERNLTLNCLYYGHKYTIGNRTLTPLPFWETHEFVMNWVFHPDDLEMELWEEDDPVLAEGYTFELKPADERLPGVYKRFKEVELPRGCQKTSTVSKAYVTISHLRQRYIFDNIYHRIIITSATTTLTEGVTKALHTLWEKSQRIKKLFGVNRYRTIRRSRGEDELKFLRRDGIYGSKTKNTVSLRWVDDSDDASGLTAFSVLYAGIRTETQGQRADEYIFDDGNTKKNSKKDELRTLVVEAFTEQIRQLDPTGKMMVCNTRQHLHDFGGKIKTPEYRQLFHIMHRRSRFIDPETGKEKAYYPIDGLGRERYSLRALDDLALVTPDAEIWSEFQNCPFDPSKRMFSRDQFQIIDLDDPRVPIEIRYGLGKALTGPERGDLEQNRLTILAYNTCDPAGKEEQSAKGDSTWIGGHRFDKNGDWWIVDLRYGQWDSDETWRQNYLAWVYNRPLAADYELPASELHVRGSFEKWKGDESKALGFAITMQMDFDHMPKSGKPTRISHLTPWTKNRKIYLLSSIPKAVRDVFLEQFHNYPQAEHDDAPDMVARCLRYVSAPSIEQVKATMKNVEPPRIVDGKFRVSQNQFLDAFKARRESAKPNWGLRGKTRRSA
jgi:predicted phage terminase large subunit-like protein